MSLNKDDFPLNLEVEVSELRESILSARQRHVSPQMDERVQIAVRNLTMKMPFGSQYQELREAVKQLSNLSNLTPSASKSDPNAEEVAAISERVQVAFQELISDECFKSFQQMLVSSGIFAIPF